MRRRVIPGLWVPVSELPHLRYFGDPPVQESRWGIVENGKILDRGLANLNSLSKSFLCRKDDRKLKLECCQLFLGVLLGFIRDTQGSSRSLFCERILSRLVIQAGESRPCVRDVPWPHMPCNLDNPLLNRDSF